MKKTSTKVSDKKIAQLQAQINIIQSEIDILRGDCIEFDSNDPQKALDWLNNEE